MRATLKYSDIEMCLRIKKDKLDGIRSLYAGIVMKKAAGCAEDWELELTKVFKINRYSGILGNEKFIHFDWGHGLSTLNGIKIYKARSIEMGDYPEKYLSAISPFLDDGYIKIASRGFYPNGDDKVCAFAVNDGKLYEMLDSDGFIFWGKTNKSSRGNSYEIGKLIYYRYDDSGNIKPPSFRVKDHKYGKRFTY